MNLLGLDIGSSSVKAAVLTHGKVRGPIVRAPFKTRHEGVRVEVDPNSLLRAVKKAVAELGAPARAADCVALSVMSPGWVAMDAQGKPLTPIITHQDRRSVDVARQLEAKVGRQRFLRLAGNRPVPGGISATTWAWYLQNEPAAIRRADLVGHLNTFLHRQLTGARVIDPSNASFTGLYDTVKQSGWSEELCKAVGASEKLLPAVLESNQVGGHVTRQAGRSFGIKEGTPVLVGIVDTSSAMLLGGAKTGQLTNNCGSTDVLGLCTDRAHPHEGLLTRALGVGKKWMSVGTLAAAGSALDWMRHQFFVDLSDSRFWSLALKLARAGKNKRTPSENAAEVCFEPYLAGERASVEQRRAGFSGLTLSTTREDLLSAVIEALARASAARLDLLAGLHVPIRHQVVVTGGAKGGLAELFQRDWKGRWTFRDEPEATLRGLAKLIE